jgi:hypothetical protein
VNHFGHYYQLVREVKTFDEVVAAARGYSFHGMPGHLVTIQDATENELVRSLLPAYKTAWIDGSDNEIENSWWFTQGALKDASMTYFNWDEYAPDGYTDENLIIIYEASGKWEDVALGSSYWFIVEYECSGCSASMSHRTLFFLSSCFLVFLSSCLFVLLSLCLVAPLSSCLLSP